ncbi:MAG: hypothetical protein ACRDLO_12620 [Solirubrobacterales bacterium]
MSSWLEPIRDALDRAPDPVTFFCRDDDGGWRDDRLRRLLDLFAELALPLDLALIPRDLGPQIARELADRVDSSGGRLGLHQHGLAHRNHEPEGRRCEFGPSRSRADQLLDIAEGRARLHSQLDARVQPIFTPPWNRCTRVTGKCLVELGFRALSRESRAEPLGVPGLIELPVRLDWFAHRKRVRRTREELAQRLASEIGGGRRPVGVMFHHSLMDDAELRDAALLLELLVGHPSAGVRPMIELIARPASPVACVTASM